jgi:hypothetical protein
MREAEAEEMIRTLDANYLSTFDLPPSSWFGRQASCYGFCWGLVEDCGLRPTTTHHRQTA